MRISMLAGTIALVLVSGGEAMAACNGNRLSAAQLSTLLSGNTVCAPAGNSTPNMTWSEFHQGGPNSGNLIDWKRGQNDAVDPTETVGTWTVVPGQGNKDVVRHNYGAGGTYDYIVYGSGALSDQHSFCGAGPEIIAVVKAGQGAC